MAGIETANNLLVIGQVVNGRYSRLASRAGAFNPGVNYTLRAVITANAVTLTVNGANALTRNIANNNLLDGLLGIGTVNADTFFDNVTVLG